MRKLIIIVSTIVFSGIAGTGSIAAQSNPHGPATSSSPQAKSADQRKADWFAHAVDDILSGGRAQSGTHDMPQGRSAGH